MTDIHVLDSARQCPESIRNKDLDAGANAATGAEMVFITTSPLYEQVWSPHKGLCLECVGSNIAEKKASLMWNTESFNVIISSPQPTNVGESSTHKDLAAGNMNTVQLVSLVSSSRSTVDVQVASLTRYRSKYLRSNGDIKLINMAKKEVLDDKNEDNQSEQKEVGICPTRISNGIHNNDPEKEAVDITHAKTSIPGQNGHALSADSTSRSLSDLRPHLAQIECTFSAATSSDHLKNVVGRKNHQTLGLAEVSAYEDSMLARNGSNTKLASSSSSTEWRQTDLALGDVEQKVHWIKKDLTGFHLIGKQCSGDVQSTCSGSEGEVGMTVALQAHDACNCEAWLPNNKDESAPVGSQPLVNVKPRNLEKGKQKVLYDEGSGSISREREGSHESVESSSCTRPLSPRKRAWNFDSKMSIPSKRSKKESNQSSCSGRFLKNDSSFMNWIIAITNGFPRPNQTTPSLAFVPPFLNNRKENFGSLAMSEDEKPVASCRTAGFNSIFQSVPRPRTIVENNINDHDHEREAGAPKEVVNTQLVHDSHHMVNCSSEFNLSSIRPVTTESIHNGSKALHVTSEPSAVGSLPITYDGESGKSPYQVSVSCNGLYQDAYKVGEFASTTVKVSSTSSTSYGNIQRNIRQVWPLSNMGSPSPSGKNGSGSPEAKETGILRSAVNSSSNLVVNSNSGFLENKWISRFMPKVSSPMLNPIPCNLDMGLASEMLNTESDMVSSPYKDCLASIKEHDMSKDHCLRSLECERGVARGEVQQYPFYSATPCATKMQGDQKLKSKLNQILPFQKFKKSEPIASLFAKRLDAFRHIMPSKTLDYVSCVTCLFCGNIGHSLRECSELVKSGLQDLPKFTNSYDGTDISSCLCVRCFQLDHWAVACPHASSRKENVDGSSFIASRKNCDKTEDKQANPSSGNYDKRTILWNGDEQEHQHLIDGFRIPERGDLRFKSKRMVYASSCMDQVSTPSANASCSNSVEDVAERIAKLKQSTSSSGGSELKQPFCRFLAPEATDEPAQIFEIIRKLRMSQTDVIRWLKSPIAHFSLEGFFLRLRIRKWEEGLGGTGYHVARINGGTCENGLSVSIGGFTHLVDCRLVSNHDFVEDELKVWWSAVLKGDCMLPSREELHKKLQERIKFGF